MTARKITLRVEGMHCASCVATVERALRAAPGVGAASVNLAASTARAEYEGESFPFAEAARLVEAAGYRLLPEEAGAEAEDGAARREEAVLRNARRRAILAWVFTAPAMLLMALHMSGAVHAAWLHHPLLYMLLSAPAVFWAGSEVLRAGFGALRRFAPHMDSLIAAGATAAFATGAGALVSSQVADFSAVGAMIMAFHLLGRHVETLTRGRASRAIRALAERGAREARVRRGGGWAMIPAAELRPGDFARVLPGEKVPADGVVREGTGAVDESLVTGESMPAEKKPGDSLTGGTLNLNGSLDFEVVRTGRDAFLGQVIALVEACQGSKVPVQALADAVVARFVPAVFVLSALTFAGWLFFHAALAPMLEAASRFLPWTPAALPPLSMALYAAVAVLVIACPCALGLATPMALMAASGLGAMHGILIRRGEALEAVKDIRVFVFDKTGTLTLGKPSVSDRVAVAHADPDGMLRLAASAEMRSEHPLAAALVSAAREKNLPLAEPEEFRAEAGFGVRARVEGKRILVGTADFLRREGVRGLDESLAGLLEAQGKTVVFAAAGGKFLGVLALRDALKPGAAEMVASLHRMGYRTAMLTGDGEAAARAVAAEAGIDDVRARVLPARKAEAVAEFQRKYGKTAMVGDGVNDAPALARADLGIAMGAGTDVAMETSGIVLTSGDPRALVAALRLSRGAFAVIRQNLAWAFGYNLLALPLAMAGLMHPVLAEVCMALSSLSVVANSLRLRRMKL